MKWEVTYLNRDTGKYDKKIIEGPKTARGAFQRFRRLSPRHLEDIINVERIDDQDKQKQ